MKTRRTVGILLAVSVAVLAPGVLLQAAPDAAMKPAAEMSNLTWFDGNWTCEGTVAPGPMGPGGKVTSAVKSHSDLGGFWQSGMVRSSMGAAPAMEGMFHMTYDAGAKHYVMLWVDNMGANALETSSGWEGDKIVWSGNTTMAGKEMGTRDTFTKSGEGAMKHDWEGQMNGNWSSMGSETCKRAAAAAKK
jgi:hypothetical protein